MGVINIYVLGYIRIQCQHQTCFSVIPLSRPPPPSQINFYSKETFFSACTTWCSPVNWSKIHYIITTWVQLDRVTIADLANSCLYVEFVYVQVNLLQGEEINSGCVQFHNHGLAVLFSHRQTKDCVKQRFSLNDIIRRCSEEKMMVYATLEMLIQTFSQLILSQFSQFSNRRCWRESMLSLTATGRGMILEKTLSYQSSASKLFQCLWNWKFFKLILPAL